MIKRFFDFLLSLIGMIMFFPLFLLIMVMVFLVMGFPVLFCQRRIGLNGKDFVIYKFRTLKNFKNDPHSKQDSDSARLTPLGQILRKTSLDELPELWNVLRGDMSLVGPRPLLPEYLPLYTNEQNRRHEVRPGITGWAQVNGRNAITWKRRFELDVWYVDHGSFKLDLKIIWMTLWKVLKGEGISAPDHATMPKFTGLE